MELTSRDQAEACRGGVRNILRGAEGMGLFCQIEMRKLKLQKMKSNLAIKNYFAKMNLN
jgi:hypothetical protein